MMKKIYLVLLAILGVTLFSCMKSESAKDHITVISREASSGTRTAFDEMVGISVKEGDQVKDNLFPEALITGSSSSVGMTVANEPNSIGYTSLASVSTNNKVVSIDGIVPNVAHIEDGSYPLHRPFLLVAQKGAAQIPVAQDFLKFVLSREGQNIVANSGYVKINSDAGSYSTPKGITGKLVISGSTSVEPVMSKLDEAYRASQPGVQLEIQYTGSTAGLKDVASGKVQLGLSSRELTTEENNTLQSIPFAHDAITVVVNSSNSITNLTMEQLRDIYTGVIRNWSQLNN